MNAVAATAAFDRDAFLAFCRDEEIDSYAQFEGDVYTDAYQLDNMLCQCTFTYDGRKLEVGALSTGDNGWLVAGQLLVSWLDADQGDFPDDQGMSPEEMAAWIEAQVLPRLERELPVVLAAPLSRSA